MLIDSHAHLNFEGFKDDLVFPGISKVINIGTNLSDSESAVKLAQENIFATVGIHPHEDCSDWEKFEKLAQSAVAIGECGLDYSRSNDRDRQISLFDRQIEIAKKLDLPMVIHIRDAQNDLISVFGHKLETMRGVFHCFSGTESYLHTILHLLPGFYVSFAGNITFKSADELRKLVKLTPLERMLVETDSPYLSPEPHRGSRNSPGNVKITAEKIAEIKGTNYIEIAEHTRKNTERLFGI